MRLPGNLYNAVKHHMSGHSEWHVARLNPAEFGRAGQAAINAACAKYPGVKCVKEAGAGEQFLEFHREMLRHFKWIVDDTAEPGFHFDEWTELPQWVIDRLEPGYMNGFLGAIPGFIAGPSVDALGAFVESTLHGITLYHGVHNTCHSVIAAAEAELYPGDSRRRDASMVEMREAPHNECFWSLHSWIDGMYAAWQLQHGIPVDVSPKPPGGHHHST